MSEVKKPVAVETVGELIDVLSRAPRDMAVLGTWEGITREIYVYKSVRAGKEPIVYIDSDEARYFGRYLGEGDNDELL